MLRQTCFLTATALLVALATPSDALSWGAYHVGYTHVGYGGVQHYGSTSAYGAGRYGSVSHYGSTSAYGGDRYGSVSHYGSTTLRWGSLRWIRGPAPTAARVPPLVSL